MKNLLPILMLVALCVGTVANAQQTFPQNGVYDEREGLFAFTNAVIYQSYNQKIDKATLLIHKGKVVGVGQLLEIPPDAVVIDLQGKSIYPSFIDLYSDHGLPEVKPAQRGRGAPQMLSKKEGAYSWNQALKPEFRAHENYKNDAKRAPAYSNGKRCTPFIL